MTPQQLEDEAARPKAPAYPGLSRAQRSHGRRLALIHEIYRRELTAVAALMNEIRAGRRDPAALAPEIGGMDLARNLAMFGTVCGRECAILQDHHDIEEQWMFPALSERAEPALTTVIDRLIAEHKVIHSLINDLQVTATALVHDQADDLFGDCAAAFDRLDRAIRSHFGYEETELAGALAMHQIPI